MNATALFLDPATSMETRELQPLPDASEAGWDRWMIGVCGADYATWQAACRNQKPKPAIDQQLRIYLNED